MEQPEQINYKGYDVFSCGAWCQGPAFLMLLRVLDSAEITRFKHNSTDYLHTFVEAVKLVMADREAFFGDPDYVQVPMAGLLSDAYNQQRVKHIDPLRAMPDMPASGDPWSHHTSPRAANGYPPRTFGQLSADAPTTPAKDTSYVCVVDRWGNTFSATPSDGYGSSPIVPGLGFPISARGSQSRLDPDHPSSIAPGKRPRLTPNPALICKDGVSRHANRHARRRCPNSGDGASVSQHCCV